MPYSLPMAFLPEGPITGINWWILPCCKEVFPGFMSIPSVSLINFTNNTKEHSKFRAVTIIPACKSYSRYAPDCRTCHWNHCLCSA